MWGVNYFLQSSHWVWTSVNYVIKVCYTFVWLFNYFSIVSFTFNLFECYSVQINPAFIILAFPNPFIFFNSKDKSYLLSLSQETHGGLKNLWQNLQKVTIASFVIPRVISVFANKQASQILPSRGLNWIPHIGHSMVFFFSYYIIP